MNIMKTNLYKELAKQSNDSNLDMIRAFVITGGEGIELTDFQKELKARIEFADEQIRGKVGLLRREAIANIIRDRFDVGRDTAFRYMRWAEELYCSSNPLNKKYKIQLRIEWCEEQAKIAAFAGDLQAAAMFESMIEKYIKQYPDAAKEKNPRKVIFIIPNSAKEQTITEDTAMELIDSHLTKTADE